MGRRRRAGLLMNSRMEPSRSPSGGKDREKTLTQVSHSERWCRLYRINSVGTLRSWSAAGKDLHPGETEEIWLSDPKWSNLDKLERNHYLTPIGEPYQKKEDEKSHADFVFSEDFRWVSLNGEEFKLSTNQAQVVEMLHKLKTPISQATVLTKLNIGAKNLAGVFRTVPNWKRLIVSVGKGIYRLNI